MYFIVHLQKKRQSFKSSKNKLKMIMKMNAIEYDSRFELKSIFQIFLINALSRLNFYKRNLWNILNSIRRSEFCYGNR